jgi:hypothetical protein
LSFMDGGDSKLPQALEQSRFRTGHVLYDDGRHKKNGLGLTCG